MNPTKTNTLPHALALCVALLVPATAGAAPDYEIKKAAFKVSVEGVQKTTWTYDHKGLGGCDTDTTGSGKETVRFSSRAVKVGATGMKGLSAPVLTKLGTYGEPVLELRGRVSRQGTMNAAPGGECGGSEDGGSIPRDCGTKSFKGVKLPLGYRLSAKPRDQLDIRPEFADDPFKNCPSGGYSFPTLVRQFDDREMRADLPREELFDKSLGKIIVIARGRQAAHDAEDDYVTTTRWVVTFERLGKRR